MTDMLEFVRSILRSLGEKRFLSVKGLAAVGAVGLQTCERKWKDGQERVPVAVGRPGSGASGVRTEGKGLNKKVCTEP
jgi:hypothetical protein